jgi:hypothetical protein
LLGFVAETHRRLIWSRNQAVGAARTATDLHDLVQAAIRLEFSTIPPYLTAMLSLRPGANREIWGNILRSSSTRCCT